MDFTLTHEQQMIQQMAREFAQQELLPGVLERDEKSEFPLEQFRKFGQTGMFGIPYGKEIGGMAGAYSCYILAVEEVSKVDASFGIAFSVMTSLYGGSIANSSAPDYQEEVSGGCHLWSENWLLWPDRALRWL